MLTGSVLVLNRSFVPVNITTVKRAFCMLYQGIARAVDEEFKTFDFKSWSELSVSVHDETIRTVDKVIKIPRVILLVTYDRLPKRHVRFSRLNVFARDNNTCQYCGKTFPRSELNIDHVIPRSRGGLTTWENVVCCCISCNRQKGGRLLHEAGMRLIRKPVKPRWTPYAQLSLKNIIYKEWLPFLDIVSASYWYTELEHD